MGWQEISLLEVSESWANVATHSLALPQGKSARAVAREISEFSESKISKSLSSTCTPRHLRPWQVCVRCKCLWLVQVFQPGTGIKTDDPFFPADLFLFDQLDQRSNRRRAFGGRENPFFPA